MLDAIYRAFDVALNKWLDALRDNIEDIVYGAGRPKKYVRTYEFLDSFEKNATTIRNNIISSEIFYNWQSLTIDSDLSQHIEAEELAEILFKGTGIDAWWGKPRDAWTPSLELFYNGTFLGWVKDEIKQYGGV